MLGQKTGSRRVIRAAAAGVAILLVGGVALLSSSGSGPARGRLTFGIAPGPVSVTPAGLAKTMAALRELKARGRPLVVHLYSVFPGDTLAAASWSSYQTYLSRALGAFEHNGFDVELVVRFAPLRGRGSQKDVRGFSALVRRIVSTFGGNRRFVSIQITNEADLSRTRASDGYFNSGQSSWQALIRGVIAAKAAARQRHYDQLRVGFNYGARNRAFWRYLGRHGGGRFTRSLDWIGIDTYAGTFTPLPTNGLRNGIGTAITRSVERTRNLYMPLAGIPPRIALHFSENGYATADGHSYAMQAIALRTAVETVSSLASSEHVTEYDWFDLRDAGNSSRRPGSQLGLLTHDYHRKPAFSVYRRLIQDFANPHVLSSSDG
jgi:hypothetical protein